MDNKMAPVHPGEILAEEFLNPMDITQHRLAISIGVPPRRINEIVHGLGRRQRRRIGYRADDLEVALQLRFGTGGPHNHPVVGGRLQAVPLGRG